MKLREFQKNSSWRTSSENPGERRICGAVTEKQNPSSRTAFTEPVRVSACKCQWPGYDSSSVQTTTGRNAKTVTNSPTKKAVVLHRLSDFETQIKLFKQFNSNAVTSKTKLHHIDNIVSATILDGEVFCARHCGYVYYYYYYLNNLKLFTFKAYNLFTGDRSE